jgi:peptidoglycan/LPS O-acetylase OafA/YrhL
MVVAYHCGIPGFGSGLIGVDVFFVLSGYLITGLLAAEVERAGRVELLQFYARRIRRLLPAASLLLVVTMAAAAVLQSPAEMEAVGHAARATAVYAGNFYFRTAAADYFARSERVNPLLHTWTLGVEEQFYLFWPILVMLGLQVWRSRRALLTLLFGLTALSLAFCIRTSSIHASVAFYMLPARAWEFGVGGLAALAQPSLRFSARVRVVVGWGALAALAASAWLLPAVSHAFPGWVAAIPVLATALALVSGVPETAGGAGMMLGSRLLQLLGRLSYSWYLWHWPFLVLAADIVLIPSIWLKSGVALAALGVAAITQRLVENPIRSHPRLVASLRATFAMAAVLTFGSAALGTALIRHAAARGRLPTLAAIATARDDRGRFPRDACLPTTDHPAQARFCVLGDTASAISLVLFGDSHAMQWFNALDDVALQRRWRLIVLAKPGCHAAGTPSWDAVYGDCLRWRENALATIDSIHPEMVVIANSTAQLPSRDIAGLRAATAGTLRRIAAHSRVMLIRDNPFFSYDVSDCLGRHGGLSGGASCSQPASRVVRPDVFAAESSAARDVPGVGLLDLTGRLCAGNYCSVVQGGRMVYRDAGHLTAGFAERLAPVLDSALTALTGQARMSGPTPR